MTLSLPADLRLTPEQFAAVCAANPEAVLELDADGQLISMTPTGGDTGARNQTLGALLWLAVRNSGQPLKVFDSSTGFLLPDGSVRSPDASLVRLERWQALSEEQRRGFPPLCPDLVVELASPSDRRPTCAAAWRPIGPMAPAWAGCSSPRSMPWRSGDRPGRAAGSRQPSGWMRAPCSPGWNSSWRRSGRDEERVEGFRRKPQTSRRGMYGSPMRAITGAGLDPSVLPADCHRPVRTWKGAGGGNRRGNRCCR